MRPPRFYLFMGDVDRYRGACREMLDRFEKRAEEKPDSCGTHGMDMRLMPDSVPDFSRVERLAERSLMETEKQPYYASCILAKALIDYRAGRYGQVPGRATRVRTKAEGRRSANASAFAILAMAHYRLGHADQARASLESARTMYRKDPAEQAVD